jgi:hypothetical protein
MSTHPSKHFSTSKYLESLPTYIFGQLEISLSYDPLKSGTFLLMRIAQRDSRTMSVIDSQEHICRALDISTDSWHRHLYSREMCSMLSNCITDNTPSLHTLQKPIEIMTRSWDILGVFLWTEDFKSTVEEPRNVGSLPSPELITRADVDLILESLSIYVEKLNASNEDNQPEFTRDACAKIRRVGQKLEALLTKRIEPFPSA